MSDALPPNNDDFWDRILGDLNLDPTQEASSVAAPGPAFAMAGGAAPIAEETLRQADAMIAELIEALQGERNGRVEAAAARARSEGSRRFLAAMLAAERHGAFEWPDDIAYRTDLDAANALCRSKLLPDLFRDLARNYTLPQVQGYAYVLLLGYRLGKFLERNPLT